MRASAGPERTVRVGRAGAATTLAVLVAVGAHLAGDGAAPSPVLVLAVVALVWPAAVALIGTRPRLWRQALVIGGAQAAMHLVFDAGGGAAGPSAGMAGMPGMTASPVPLATAPTHAGSGMFCAHVVSWLLTVAAWRWGERAIRSLLAPARTLVALLDGTSAAGAVPRQAPPAAGRPFRPAAVPCLSLTRRGPPLPH